MFTIFSLSQTQQNTINKYRVSCEEDETVGYVWQVDPAGIRKPQKTSLVDHVGDWESFEYCLDVKNKRIEFFVTHDSYNGALVRYVPGNKKNNNGRYEELNWDLLHGDDGIRTFLKLDEFMGTFEWVEDRDDANPSETYPNLEGIDVVDDMMYFVSKEYRSLYILNLTSHTYTTSSTEDGAFNQEPDQIKWLLPHKDAGGGDDDNDNNGILYFCEDGTIGSGLHGRDSTG